MWKRIALLGALTALTIAAKDASGKEPALAAKIPPRKWDTHVHANPATIPAAPTLGNGARWFHDRPFIPRRVFCCDDRRFFPGPFGRPPYFYGDSFAPYRYNWNGGYTNAGYGYDWNGGYTNAGYGYY